MNSSTRRSYSVTEKLTIHAGYKNGVTGCGFLALSKSHGIPPATLRGWWRNREKLRAAVKKTQVVSRSVRRLNGGGRKAAYEDVETQLQAWMLDRNQKGLRVKDAYIRLQALNIYHNLHGEDASGYDASTGWLARFKVRKKLVSRRQTTTRTLPAEAPLICREFIQRAQQLISEHKIKLHNIINMDQVPRYFETEPKSTIATRGSREVLLRKGGSSHKRFTATFTITADGKILQPHLLFSKLKNKPACPDGVLVDVNATGMWSDEILLAHANTVVCRRKETQLYREPVLYLIGSYACYVKLEKSNWLKRFNIFVLVIPPNLTNILQLLDVAVNRSYQESYRSRYDEYISKALVDPDLQTPMGNPKVLRYSEVAQWTLDWVATKTTADIMRAFQLCGLVPKESFLASVLHPPLRDILSADLDIECWHESYQHLLEEADEREQIVIGPPTWYLPDDERSSILCCLLHGISIPIQRYIHDLTGYMESG